VQQGKSIWLKFTTTHGRALRHGSQVTPGRTIMGANCFLFTSIAMCFLVGVTVLFSTAASRAEVRIVAVQDSQIRGYGVAESQAYPAQLEAALRPEATKSLWQTKA
jgi:hypothetical protein